MDPTNPRIRSEQRLQQQMRTVAGKKAARSREAKGGKEGKQKSEGLEPSSAEGMRRHQAAAEQPTGGSGEFRIP
jgi:hypothetical protein